MESGGASQDAGCEPGEGTAFQMESLWRVCERTSGQDADDPLIGRTLDGVTLVRVIADGGMGRVYEGEQHSPRRAVAVKVIRPGLLSRDTVARFVREVAVLATLRHPWISQIFSAGTFDFGGARLPYFVMEFVSDARSITDHVRHAGLPVAEIIALFRDVCDAVAHGHESGVVHRDLKPSNILVDGVGRPKVIDFGVARSTHGNASITTLTDVGQVLGTLQYMGPEQLRGPNSRVDARADVYALGVILYELLAGVPPLDLTGKSLPDALRAVDEHRPIPLRSINPTIPREIDRVVQRCLAKDQDSRFADARELCQVLDQTAFEKTRVRTAFREPLFKASRLGMLAVTGCLGAIAILTGVYMKPPYLWPPRPDVPGTWGAVVGSSSGESVWQAMDGEPKSAGQPTFALMLTPATITQTADKFHFAIRDLHQPGADRFLVDASGMKRWTDEFMFPRISYWAPAANGVEGVLVYRFDFRGRAHRIRLRARSDCWDFTKQAGGIGRGASAMEVSRDGKTWQTIEDNVEPRRWGQVISVDEELLANVSGGNALWLRVRCVTEGAPVEHGYNVAQFCRTRPGEEEPVLEVLAFLADN